MQLTREIAGTLTTICPKCCLAIRKLLEETKKLITPVKVYSETDSSTVADAKCNKRQKQLDFGTNISTNGQNGNNSSENISVVVNTTEREVLAFEKALRRELGRQS